MPSENCPSGRFHCGFCLKHRGGLGTSRPRGDWAAPRCRRVMVMDIYVAIADGGWIYEPKVRALLPRMKNEICAQTGLQDFLATAPVHFTHIAHAGRMLDIALEERRLYASVDADFIARNVHVSSAWEGLATVFRGSRRSTEACPGSAVPRSAIPDRRADAGDMRAHQ